MFLTTREELAQYRIPWKYIRETHEEIFFSYGEGNDVRHSF